MFFLQYIVIDFEWNQPTVKEKTITEPVVLNGEIIRIGAVRLTLTADGCTPSDTFQISVLPKYYKKMNSAVGRVTGLGSSALTFGYDFTTCYSHFCKWCSPNGEDFCLLAWGGEDERILLSNLEIHGITDLPIPRVYDIQRIFTIEIAKKNKQYSVQAALEFLGLEADLKAHVALNDAIFAARIGAAINVCMRLEHYDRMIADDEAQRSLRYFRSYHNIPTKDDVLSNRKIMNRICPVCRKRLIGCGEWVWQDDFTVISFGSCHEHGDFYVRIRMRETDSGKYTVTKMLRPSTEQCMAFYESKQEVTAGSNQ
ncbi:MAG: exonuclease domain-containing protein [Oscillospiraceae bacterium]|nr:exonuclease domain-containing protein [Oscillospiraceae bacterium]